MPVAKATLIHSLSPVITVVAGVVMLGERATVFRVGGIALGLAGVSTPALDFVRQAFVEVSESVLLIVRFDNGRIGFG
ncbi:EamA family transporter [Aliiroseovarius sp. Z3]|nr:EamA family transporter [Aliiroseovarius sp. Z3]